MPKKKPPVAPSESGTICTTVPEKSPKPVSKTKVVPTVPVRPEMPEGVGVNDGKLKAPVPLT